MVTQEQIDEVVKIYNLEIVVNSLDIARLFKISHKRLLEEIYAILEFDYPNNLDYFLRFKTSDGGRRKTCFLIKAQGLHAVIPFDGFLLNIIISMFFNSINNVIEQIKNKNVKESLIIREEKRKPCKKKAKKINKLQLSFLC